jgi:hypothetical protein
MSLHGVAPEILFQAENDRNFVAAAITRTWVIRDANTEVTIWENFGFQGGIPSLPIVLIRYLFSIACLMGCFQSIVYKRFMACPFLAEKSPSPVD